MRFKMTGLVTTLALTTACASPSAHHAAASVDHGVQASGHSVAAAATSAATVAAVPLVASGAALSVTGAAIESVGTASARAGSDVLDATLNSHPTAVCKTPTARTTCVAPQAAPQLE